jgi:transcriptional coactivator HFI1/ADA1
MSLIAGRMLPFCYEAGLVNGHVPEASNLMSVATETFIKEVLTQIFSRTQSNGPGESGSAGYGIGTTWVQTHKYRRQLHREEDAAQRGEISRDKSGLLPIESKAASERGPLGIADMRIALEMADSGISQFPIISAQILYGYREGELENWDDYTWANGEAPAAQVEEIITNGSAELTNGTLPDAMDIDNEVWWEGAEKLDMDMIDSALDSCLAVGS